MIAIRSTHYTFLLFFVFLFFSSFSVSAQDLVEQLPNAFTDDVLDVAMNANGSGMAIAGGGKILLTSNFGTNWEVRSGNTFNTTRVEAIPGTTEGFVIVLREAILVTSDGGQTLTTSTLPTLTGTARLNRVSLPSDNVFYVCSEDDILKSFDGGSTWALLTPPAMDREWNEIYFVTETEGWVSDNMGTLYYTTNGGNTWVIRNDTAFEDGFVFDFLTEDIGYAAVYRDLHKTLDGGISWSMVLEGAFGSHMEQVEIITEQQIVFSQLALSDYVTADGGMTVDRESPLGYGGDHGYLTSLPDGRVWAGTDYGGLGYSTDGGLSYVDQIPGLKHGFLSIDVNEMAEGWAAGRAGQVVRTNNGGELWSTVSASLPNDLIDNEPPSINFIRSIDYAEAILGASRMVLKTTDGGNSWDVILEPDEDKRFKSVASIGNSIWAFQSDGTLFRSTDLGQNWATSEADPSPFTSLDDMHFPTEQAGFIVSFNGSVVRTTDGGVTWAEVPSFTDERLRAPYFKNAMEGWVLIDGYADRMFHTTDGGDNWTEVNFGTSSFWVKVHENEFDGVYVFGGSSGSGRVVRSVDSGENWELFISEFLTSYQDYAYLAGGNSYSYWVSGYAGYIGKVDISLVGTNEISVQQLEVFPNPSQGKVQLVLPVDWSETAQLLVYNIYGQLVQQQTAERQLDISGLSKGTYILELKSNNELYVARLILE